MSSLPIDFYDKVEQPGFLKHILYGDTDSLYLVVPTKEADKLTTEEKLKVANDASEEINLIIQKYLNEYYLPKSNISPVNNMTYFKTEMLMDSIMLLDVKKNYAYKILAKKGKIFKEPKVKYTGIQVVKSDAAKLTQNMLKDIIEKVILNTDISQQQYISKTTEIINNYYNQFIKNCDNLDVNFISFPGKWSKKIMFINGMLLYNFIMNKEVFSLSSSANFIYCNFKNPKLFQGSKIDMSKLNGICIPYQYDIETLKKKFTEFQIEIDKKTQWDKLFTTTVQRCIDLIKSTKKEL